MGISNGQGSVDANKLFKHNFNRMKTLYYAVFCFGSSFFIDHAKSFWEFGLRHRTTNANIDYVVSILEEFNINPYQQAKEYPLGETFFYEAMYNSPWTNHLSIELEHRKIFKSIHDWFTFAK